MTTSDRTPSTRRPAFVFRASVLGLVVAVAAAAAPEGGAAGGAPGDSHYVIRVTPTLVYLDAGANAGAAEGQSYVIAREQDGQVVRVGQVRVIRVDAEFAIAEITGVEPGEEIAVLHRALEIAAWEQLTPEEIAVAAPRAAAEPETAAHPGRAILLLGGADLQKDVDLTYGSAGVTAADGVSGGAIGLRLARTWGRHVRLALTYRVSGEVLTARADVTQMSLEADSQILFRRAGRPGPFVGVGVGLHRLSWDTPGSAGVATYKAGLHLTGGLDIPVGRGRWGLLLEGGYQKVLAWDDRIDASSVRAYAGLGRNF